MNRRWGWKARYHPDGMLAGVLRGVRPVFTGTPVAQGALPELLGEHAVSAVQHGILAPCVADAE